MLQSGPFSKDVSFGLAAYLVGESLGLRKPPQSLSIVTVSENAGFVLEHRHLRPSTQHAPEIERFVRQMTLIADAGPGSTFPECLVQHESHAYDFCPTE